MQAAWELKHICTYVSNNQSMRHTQMCLHRDTCCLHEPVTWTATLHPV